MLIIIIIIQNKLRFPYLTQYERIPGGLINFGYIGLFGYWFWLAGFSCSQGAIVDPPVLENIPPVLRQNSYFEVNESGW